MNLLPSTYDADIARGPEVGAEEWVCDHCGDCVYGPEPDYRECPVCKDQVCDACQRLRCKDCDAELHYGCVARVGNLILCEKCRGDYLDEIRR